MLFLFQPQACRGETASIIQIQRPTYKYILKVNNAHNLSTTVCNLRNHFIGLSPAKEAFHWLWIQSLGIDPDPSDTHKSEYRGHPFRVSGVFPSTYHQGLVQYWPQQEVRNKDLIKWHINLPINCCCSSSNNFTYCKCCCSKVTMTSTVRSGDLPLGLTIVIVFQPQQFSISKQINTILAYRCSLMLSHYTPCLSTLTLGYRSYCILMLTILPVVLL